MKIINKLIVAASMALFLAIPILFEHTFSYSKGIALIFILNMPGLMLAIPHIPPEGMPGHSLPHALIMICAQTLVWFVLINLFVYLKGIVNKKFIKKNSV